MENRKIPFTFLPVSTEMIQKYGHSTALVFGYIYSMCNQRGVCYASQRTIGDAIGLSRRQIIRIITVLERNKFITIEQGKTLAITLRPEEDWLPMSLAPDVTDTGSECHTPVTNRANNGSQCHINIDNCLIEPLIDNVQTEIISEPEAGVEVTSWMGLGDSPPTFNRTKQDPPAELPIEYRLAMENLKKWEQEQFNRITNGGIEDESRID